MVRFIATERLFHEYTSYHQISAVPSTYKLYVEAEDKKVSSMLEKKTIQEIAPSPGWYRLFVVPKKMGVGDIWSI